MRLVSNRCVHHKRKLYKKFKFKKCGCLIWHHTFVKLDVVFYHPKMYFLNKKKVEKTSST